MPTVKTIKPYPIDSYSLLDLRNAQASNHDAAEVYSHRPIRPAPAVTHTSKKKKKEELKLNITDHDVNMLKKSELHLELPASPHVNVCLIARLQNAGRSDVHC